MDGKIGSSPRSSENNPATPESRSGKGLRAARRDLEGEPILRRTGEVFGCGTSGQVRVDWRVWLPHASARQGHGSVSAAA